MVAVITPDRGSTRKRVGVVLAKTAAVLGQGWNSLTLALMLMLETVVKNGGM
jgi:hypothetical protein